MSLSVPLKPVIHTHSSVPISSDFVFTTDVKNLTGAELPETGGMGTTLIYTVGGILCFAALVLLITKKRMASEQ